MTPRPDGQARVPLHRRLEQYCFYQDLRDHTYSFPNVALVGERRIARLSIREGDVAIDYCKSDPSETVCVTINGKKAYEARAAPEPFHVRHLEDEQELALQTVYEVIAAGNVI